MTAPMIIAMCVAVGLGATSIIHRIRYARWLERGRAINRSFALWMERRQAFLDAQVVELERMPYAEQARVRRAIAFFMRWADEIIAERAEWERTAP